MANEVKYTNVNWPDDTPIAGERLATNGYYTGEHMGTPTQDAIDNLANKPYYAERVTVRYGTITQDAIDSNMPKKAICVDQDGNGYDNLQDAIDGVGGED